jgi:hypothetical protein
VLVEVPGDPADAQFGVGAFVGWTGGKESPGAQGFYANARLRNLGVVTPAGRARQPRAVVIAGIGITLADPEVQHHKHAGQRPAETAICLTGKPQSSLTCDCRV